MASHERQATEATDVLGVPGPGEVLAERKGNQPTAKGLIGNKAETHLQTHSPSA